MFLEALPAPPTRVMGGFALRVHLRRRPRAASGSRRPRPDRQPRGLCLLNPSVPPATSVFQFTVLFSELMDQLSTFSWF